MVGGVAGFMGALIIGPRIGRFHSETNTVVELRGHSVPVRNGIKRTHTQKTKR